LPSSISYSCTTPDPGGIGNITANPLFVVKTANNYHLQSGSPCIDSGSNTNMDTRDLDGVLLPVDGNESGTATVDMGCYEYLNPTNDYDLDTIPNGWEADHNLNPAVDDRSENMDNDSFDNFEEYIADTDPTDPNDGFQILEVSNNVVFFNSSDARRYTLLGCTNLISKDWNPVQDSKRIFWLKSRQTKPQVVRTYRPSGGLSPRPPRQAVVHQSTFMPIITALGEFGCGNRYRQGHLQADLP
jgi:hypothetical protein